MIIAYWSPIHGQAGTTSNLLSTALISSMVHNIKCLLAQTHFSFNNLEAPLVGSNSKNSASMDYFRDVGLDALIRSFKAARIDRETIENCCISLSDANINLLPGTSKMNKDSFDNEMEAVFVNLLRAMEEYSGIIFVDISSGNNQLSMKIMENASLSVVNLSQNMEITDYYFHHFKNFIKSRIFYLFGNYDNKSKYNIHNIRRRYHRFITPLNSGVIPHNTRFHDAQCDRKAIDFFKDNLISSRTEENGYFIKQVLRSTDKILTSAGVKHRDIKEG